MPQMKYFDEASQTWKPLAPTQTEFDAFKTETIRLSAETVKEVNGAKPVGGKITIPVPDTSTLATKTELQSVASGSPKGVYPTLTALQSAFPTGNTNIYVVSADGKWYFWNGTVWTSGGMYQSTGIADSGVGMDNLDTQLRNDITLKKTISSRNLIDSRVYSGVLVSSLFYDSGHKTAEIIFDKSLILAVDKNYRTELFFSDGTKADVTIGSDLTIAYLNGTTVVATTNNSENKLIGVNAPTIDRVQFLFGGSARSAYAGKTITGFVLYENQGSTNIMTSFEPFAVSHRLINVETLKSDMSVAKTNIAELATGTSFKNGAIKPSSTSFVKVLNMMDIATVYKDKTLVTGVLTNSIGSTVIEIPVTPLNFYYLSKFSDGIGVSGLYDINMAFLGNFGTIPTAGWNKEFQIPSNVHNVRFVLLDTYKNTMFWGLVSDFADWQNGKVGKLSNIKVVQDTTGIIDAFLPKEIYCAVGTTIELYNKQVCLQAEKYNIQWVSTIGRAMKRKFVIQGIQSLIGNHALTLNILDDKLNKVWTGTTTIKIVDTSLTNSYTYTALGDSLSSVFKDFLSEVRRLSSEKIKQVGKIPYSQKNPVDGLTYTGFTDGRGGFSAGDYLTAKTSNDSAAGGINEGVHAFWNPSLNRFDWNYYVTNTLNGVSPNFVQLFLGTNGMSLDPTTNANNIKKIIDYIRQDAPTMPVYVVNTLYRGNQDGIGKQGNNEGYSASGNAYKYEEDKKVFNLWVKLNDILSTYSNLHLIPVAPTFDSEYNFGAVVTPVNPRSTQTEILPQESVHPSTYLQMADIMFSTFVGTLD